MSLENSKENKSLNAKVQTNDYKVNVLVETTNSTNMHYSHLNKQVQIDKVLSDEEIIELWENRKVDDKLKLAKDWIKTQEGYATSNCVDDSLDIDYNSIVKYSNK